MRRLGLVFSAIVLVATMSFGQSKKVNLVSSVDIVQFPQDCFSLYGPIRG